MKTAKVTMADRLLARLKRGWCTPLDALQDVGCLSLAQRVSEWRRAGLNILSKWVDLPSGKRVMAYRLAKGS